MRYLGDGDRSSSLGTARPSTSLPSEILAISMSSSDWGGGDPNSRRRRKKSFRGGHSHLPVNRQKRNGGYDLVIRHAFDFLTV